MIFSAASPSAERFARLIRPRSIAVVGGREAARVAEQCDRLGFDGALWPVHPKRDTVAGHPAYPSIAELPAAPDAAFVGVNRHATVDAVAALARAGAGGAVCYASGFLEANDGGSLQRALVEAAAEMPIVGPNCYGLINFLDGVPLWPDQHGGRRLGPEERGVAIVTQSSNIGVSLTMQQRGIARRLSRHRRQSGAARDLEPRVGSARRHAGQRRRVVRGRVRLGGGIRGARAQGAGTGGAGGGPEDRPIGAGTRREPHPYRLHRRVGCRRRRVPAPARIRPRVTASRTLSRR